MNLSEFRPARVNANRHTARGIGALEKSIQSDGWIGAMTTAADGEMIAGSARIETAAGVFGVDAEPVVIHSDGKRPIVVIRDDIPNASTKVAQRLALADNRIHQLDLDFDVQVLTSFDADVLEGLWTGDEISDMGQQWADEQSRNAEDPGAQVDKAEELQAKWHVQPGDLWAMGDHRLLCGDCREPASWVRLLAGVKANGVFTSPPYAEQRKEQYGGTPAAEYVAWWEAVQANVKAHLAPDGSFFVNIKPHCADGERVLYVFDLVLAMKREWGWRFVDELCWTNRGFPGEPQDRFQNAFEPVYHFSDGKIKFRPKAVWHSSDSVPVHKAGQNFRQSNRGNGFESPDVESGMAYPRNVLDIPNGNGGDSRHAAAFPVALPDFFVRAYSDAGDVWLDPFCGSGTTIVAAHNNKRRGFGIEMLPKYCAVILERISGLGITPALLSNGGTVADGGR
jgi:site-specific DNA-methyltransferase (adenine-specific)/site-specific DNA-methyltransferase (cytosine-N4-specific)